MRRSTHNPRSWWNTAVLCAAILAMVVAITGCKCSREEPQEEAAVSPPGLVREPVAEPARELVKPVTLDVLRLMPASALLALGVPPPSGVFEKALKLAKRLAPKDADIDGAVRKAVEDLATEAGVPDAASFGDIARAIGIDPDAPFAVFLGEPPMEEILRALVSVDKGSAGPSEQAADDSAAGFEKPPVPPVAAVLSCTDVERAETTLKEMLTEATDLDLTDEEVIEIQGVTIHSYDPTRANYFFVEERLVFGTSLELVKEIAARLSDPGEIRYGTEDCTATQPDEIVQLIRVDKLAHLSVGMLQTISMLNPGFAAAGNMQLQAMEDLYKYYEGADPAVLTLIPMDDLVELLFRIDMETHPKLVSLTGEPAPLRLARLLPESALALLGTRFTPEAKARWQESAWLSAMPPHLQGAPQAGPGTDNLKEAVELIGDELALGVAGAADGIPRIMLMLALADEEQARGFLQGLGIPMTPGQTYNNVPIMTLPIPLPTPVSYAIVEQTLVVSNDMAELKTALDGLQSGSASGLFNSLEPPLDPNAPRFGFFLVKSSIWSDVIKPFALAGAPFPTEHLEQVNIGLEALRELRITQDMHGTWLRQRGVLYFN